MSTISEIAKYSKIAFGLWHYLHTTVSLEQSKKIVSARLQDRERNFLSLVNKGVYGNPKSPFLTLLKISGCEYGDLESLVNKDGIEATLHKLLAKGVYLSWEEFKCKKEVIRGTNHLHFKESDFDNPFLPAYYYKKSSGSRSTGTRTMFDLRFQLEKHHYHWLMLEANNALDVPMGLWKPNLPATNGIDNVFRHWMIRKPVAKWFTPVEEKQTASWPYRLATRTIIYSSRLWGAKLVPPEFVPLSDAKKVARWIALTKEQFGGCAFNCAVSPAVMVCQAAKDNFLDIRGTHFFVGGEPLTKAKRKQIEDAGAQVTSKYSISEVGSIGCGCPGGRSDDDVHQFHDSVALIQHIRKVEQAGINVNAFLFTSLLPAAPKILINVESDDYGTITTGHCGCLFEELGFNKHLHDIRSFAKLTGIGTTVVGSDFVRILEEVLPNKYGGAATDYQLLEEEDSQGHTYLSLVINPRIGTIDNGDVITTVLDELRSDRKFGRFTYALWSQVESLKIKRMEPVSISGKVLTLHLMKK